MRKCREGAPRGEGMCPASRRSGGGWLMGRWGGGGGAGGWRGPTAEDGAEDAQVEADPEDEAAGKALMGGNGVPGGKIRATAWRLPQSPALCKLGYRPNFPAEDDIETVDRLEVETADEIAGCSHGGAE